MRTGIAELLVMLAVALPVAVAMLRRTSSEGYSMRSASSEATRLATAHAILGGSVFRRSVIERARDRHRAINPELGLDFELVLQVALWMERRALRYELLFLGGTGLGLLLAITVPPFSVLLGFCLAGIIAYKSYEEQFVLASELRQGRFDPEQVRALFAIEIPPELRASIPQIDQNVIAYAGFSPFDAAGFEAGGWSFVVDTARAKDSSASPASPAAALGLFDTHELLDAVDVSIAELQPSRVRCRDYLVLHGTDVGELSLLLPEPFARPRQTLKGEASAPRIDALQERARWYKWIQIFDWGDELVVSNLLYCNQIGDNLFVDSKHYLLTPLAPAYRRIDRIPNARLRTIASSVLPTLLLSPLFVALEVGSLLVRIIAALAHLIGSAERATRRQIADGPRFNYGAALGLRRQMAGSVFTHYFQKTDQEMFAKLVNKRVLDAIVDFLDEHGIDTSEIRERQSTILNNGIIVHGGDVKAQSMAVGSGAHASGMFSRLRGSRPPAQAQAVDGGSR